MNKLVQWARKNLIKIFRFYAHGYCYEDNVLNVDIRGKKMDFIVCNRSSKGCLREREKKAFYRRFLEIKYLEDLLGSEEPSNYWKIWFKN